MIFLSDVLVNLRILKYWKIVEKKDSKLERKILKPRDFSTKNCDDFVEK